MRERVLDERMKISVCEFRLLYTALGSEGAGGLW